jgi:hypothetical protein
VMSDGCASIRTDRRAAAPSANRRGRSFGPSHRIISSSEPPSVSCENAPGLDVCRTRSYIRSHRPRRSPLFG